MAFSDNEENDEKNNRQLIFNYLPDYAAFLLKEAYTDYVEAIFKYVYEEKVPLLQYVDKHSDGDVYDLISKVSYEMLSALANNKVQDFVQSSAVIYAQELLPFFEREAVVAEDITIISFLRRKAMRKFLGRFTTDTRLHEAIIEELDRFIAANELASFNAFLEIKQENINQINKELAQRQEELFEAEELAQMGSFLWNFEISEVKFTPGLKNILGITEADTLTFILKKVHPDDRDVVKDAIEKVLSGEDILDCEYRYTNDNIEKRIWSRGVVKFRDGQPVSLKGTVMDVTSRYRLIEQLRESEELYKQAQKVTHIGNWVWDIKADKIIWSDEMYRIYGLQPQSEEMTFEKFFSYIHPDERERQMDEVRELLEHKQSKGFLMRIISSDGTEKILKGKSEVIVDKNNEPVKLMGTSQDITTEHKLTTALQEKERYLNQLIDNAPDAVIVTDKNSIINLWNPKTEEIFGWKAEEVLGRSLSETIIPPQHREAHVQGMKRLLTTGEARILNRTVELSALNKRGEEFSVSLTVSQSMQQDKLSFIGFIRDISEEKKTKAELQMKTIQLERLNKSLQLKNNELESTNKELESFNYVVSHDLQEPLRKIQIFANRILEKTNTTLPPTTLQFLNKIVASSHRMKRLIEDLLTFSQVTASEDNFQKTDLNIILIEVKNLLSAAIDEKNVIIESERLPVVLGLPTQLQQLFLNLISNSIKYSRENIRPNIKISSTITNSHEIEKINNGAPTEYFQMVFEDNGIGFEPAYTEKVFDLFQRLHHKNEYSGTGIGLAICKKIVSNHHGFIRAEGFPGEGSVFYVYLPKKDF